MHLKILQCTGGEPPTSKNYVDQNVSVNGAMVEKPCFNWILAFPLIVNVRNPSAAAAKSLQSCQTLCDPIDGSPPGSPVPGILQARTQEWVAISFSSAWKWKVKVKSLSRVWLLATSWTAAYQAPPSMGFSRQEYWSGVPLPSPKKPLTWILMLPITLLPCEISHIFISY